MINESIQRVSVIEEEGYSGYKIVTNSCRVKLLIEDFQGCCESYGYITSEDNLTTLVGKTLLRVEFTNTELNSWVVDKIGYNDFDCGGIQFITLILQDSLPVQFAVYNGHNGYYGHNIKFITEELETL